MDLIKAMIEQFGEDAVDKKLCKSAIRSLIDSGRCIYSYVGGSYVTLPREASYRVHEADTGGPARAGPLSGRRTGRGGKDGKSQGSRAHRELVNALRQWQAIERQAVDTCAEIMEKTDNPLIRQIMEIIRNDSVQHHRVQQFIIDSLTKEAVTLTPEELAEVWDEITAHDEVERKTIELAKEARKESAVSSYSRRCWTT